MLYVSSSQTLLRRMDTRKAYRFSGEVEIRGDISRVKEHFNPREIFACAGGVDKPEDAFRESDIIVDCKHLVQDTALCILRYIYLMPYFILVVKWIKDVVTALDHFQFII